MNGNDERSNPAPRRTFFKRVAAAAASVVAAGGLLPKLLRTADDHAARRVKVRPHPAAVKRES